MAAYEQQNLHCDLSSCVVPVSESQVGVQTMEVLWLKLKQLLTVECT